LWGSWSGSVFQDAGVAPEKVGWAPVSKQLGLGIALVLALLAGGLGYWLTANRGRDDGQEASSQVAGETTSPGQAMIEETTIKHSPGGRTAWRVLLEGVTLKSGGGSIAAQAVREAVIYDNTGKPMVRVTAQSISGNTKKRDLQVEGNVRAVSPEGAVFDTSIVKWVQDEQKLVCPSTVTMRDRDTVVRANSIDFYVNQDLVTSSSKVQMSVANNTLVGDNLRYNVKTQDFSLKAVQAVFDAEKAREELSR
jgi:LPS export ABC transporter protein LptC